MADKALNKAAARLDDKTWGHRWGFADTRFVVNPDRSVKVTGQRYAVSGYDMPGFIPFVEEMLGVQIDLNDIKPERADKPVPEPNLNAGFMADLAAAFPAARHTTDRRERLLHSHGQTTADEVYQVLYNHLDRVVDLVVYPESQDDVVRLIELAADHNVCLVPYGGGTSVSCALKLPDSDPRMIVSVDMRRMDAIEWVDRENFRACVQAGITGKVLEEKLAELGFTCGHEPDSVELSTLGGWIATNASGMKKNRYGNIEDIVEQVTLVTPQGVVENLDAMPRVSMGIEPQQVAFGSEGNLGIITRAVIRIHQLPEVTRYGSLVFRDFKTGTDFLFDLSRSGALPASIRLVDNVQFRFGQALKGRATSGDKLMSRIQKTVLTDVKGFDPHELVAATIVMEGAAAEVAHQEAEIKRLARKHGGISGGAHNGQRGYMLTYAIAYIRDFLTDYHIIGETYETTVPWSRISEVCDAVAARAAEMHKSFGLPGRAYVSPRITQVYHTGVCIYFTHGFSAKGADAPDRIFAEIEHAMRETIMAHGGSISHHHGIGKLRRDFLPQTLTPASVELLRDIKAATDPQNVFGVANNVFAPEPAGQ
ncbi:FAD-binding oxidoreductase [Promineifilum sp.]|uniref:FAD-binding oxidoreductase n=1 Tax=Promineifilum sp. TaxID=2664178 RepID=UPI0035B3D3B1